MEKIDVCVISRDGKLPKGLEYIPINNVIVETSKPIGYARRMAIQKVTTKWFAFIDDDMEITPYWFSEISRYVDNEEVGGISGSFICKGLGIFDKMCLFKPEMPRVYTEGALAGNNSLVRTEAVIDWVGDVKCFEDDLIGNHVRKKGYKTMFVSTLCYHEKTWGQLRRSGLWYGKEFSGVYGKRKIPLYIYNTLKEPFRALLYMGLLSCLFRAYLNFFVLIGVLYSLFNTLTRSK